MNTYKTKHLSIEKYSKDDILINISVSKKDWNEGRISFKNGFGIFASGNRKSYGFSPNSHSILAFLEFLKIRRSYDPFYNYFSI